jgi:hypothetical protein
MEARIIKRINFHDDAVLYPRISSAHVSCKPANQAYNLNDSECTARDLKRVLLLMPRSLPGPPRARGPELLFWMTKAMPSPPFKTASFELILN